MNVHRDDQHAARAERIHVQGRVQGVGFRYHVREVARAAGLAGWVRNRADGSVEVVAQGSPEALARLAVEIAEGPPLARVTSVERDTVEFDAGRDGFRIRG